ncbi:hypothetical protein DWX58_07080 [Pseudoflavonifractor sp. AF19-9AC]|nr:hypothetical protein DWX58_07080 [Pseudoflavonifractor sp. AF19-9AC]
MDFDRLQGWLTKHIQVLCHGASDGGSVCSIWFIPIPLNCSIVDPNMRSDSIRKIRIVRYHFAPNEIDNGKIDVVDQSAQTVDHLHRKRIIIAQDGGVIEFDSYS